MESVSSNMKVRTLEELLQKSKATECFKQDVQTFTNGGKQESVTFRWPAPSVKIMRVVMKILEEFPELPIERVEVKGASGCSTFSGSATIEPGNHRVNFEWDCRWRAEQLGWRDAFGDPDQARAARDYGYQCFSSFTAPTLRKAA